MTTDGVQLGLRAAVLLARHGDVELERGLTPGELDEIEERCGFAFADDHRAFLGAGLPVGGRWPNWRRISPALRERLDRPIRGIVFDIEYNSFWHPTWGPRPADATDAVGAAVARLATVPIMVPVYGHRYLPAGYGTWGNPVFLVHRTDVVHYGCDLADYIAQDFSLRHTGPPRQPRSVPFWGDLACR